MKMNWSRSFQHRLNFISNLCLPFFSRHAESTTLLLMIISPYFCVSFWWCLPSPFVLTQILEKQRPEIESNLKITWVQNAFSQELNNIPYSHWFWNIKNFERCEVLKSSFCSCRRFQGCTHLNNDFDGYDRNHPETVLWFFCTAW